VQPECDERVLAAIVRLDANVNTALCGYGCAGSFDSAEHFCHRSPLAFGQWLRPQAVLRDER
jgi:hypothetical protein